MLPKPRPITAALNHILRSTPVAMERLRPFAGRTAAFQVGPLDLAFTVQTTGEVTAALPGTAHDVAARISPFLLPRLALQEEAAWREVVIQGDPAFAQEVSFLARHLRWDVEEDLSKAVGDVAARRTVEAAQTGAEWSAQAGLRLAASAAEYWTEEDPLIASRVKVADFVREALELRDAVERLEKRIERLEG